MEKPTKPLDTDCCKSGCIPCVFDVYEELLKKWEVSKVSAQELRHDLLSPLKYKPFVLLDIRVVNDSTNVYTFTPQIPDCSDVNEIIEGILPYEPGQHFIVVNAKPDDGKTFSRCYTPISLSRKQDNCRIKFLIKLYKHGAMSSRISQLKLNDIMYFRGAFGSFRHFAHSKYIMICAGTGFAPLYTLIKSILEDDKDETLMRLIFTCSSPDHIYFRDEIREFGKFWNFTSVVYVSGEMSRNEIRHDETIYSARISGDVIANEISTRVNYKVLICGPNSFNTDIICYAEHNGICKDDIFVF